MLNRGQPRLREDETLAQQRRERSTPVAPRPEVGLAAAPFGLEARHLGVVRLATTARAIISVSISNPRESRRSAPRRSRRKPMNP
jgi:hypothetical protein